MGTCIILIYRMAFATKVNKFIKRKPNKKRNSRDNACPDYFSYILYSITQLLRSP